MLDKLLGSLDESIFTPEVQQEIKESFDAAVTLKATTLVDDRLDELEMRGAEYIEFLDEKAEAYVEFLDEKAQEYVDLKTDKLRDDVEAYLDHVVSEVVKDIEDSLNDAEDALEVKAVREAFDAMLSVAGVEMQKNIVESANDVVQAEIQQSKARYNQAMSEIIELKEENEKLIVLGIVQELSSDMTIIESARFAKLAETVPFTRDQKYLDRLTSIKEGMKITTVQEPNRINEGAEPVTPAKNSIFDFSHLV